MLNRQKRHVNTQKDKKEKEREREKVIQVKKFKKLVLRINEIFD